MTILAPFLVKDTIMRAHSHLRLLMFLIVVAGSMFSMLDCALAQTVFVRAPAPISVPMMPAGWQQAPNYNGPVSSNDAGLILQGGAWTNGRLQNGAYDGNRIYSKEVFVFSDGGDAYMRFSVNAGGKYLGIWPRVIEGVSVAPLTTDHSWAGSVVIPENTWIFAHLHVNVDGTYQVVVTLDNYDVAGGRAIYQNAGRFVYPRGRLELQFADNYAGNAASVTMGDARVLASSSAPVASPIPADDDIGLLDD
jgi:hypothetical protein